MTQAAYAGWKADMLAGKVTLMAAATNAVVTELSAQARADAWPPDRSSPEPSSMTGTWPARATGSSPATTTAACLPMAAVTGWCTPDGRIGLLTVSARPVSMSSGRSTGRSGRSRPASAITTARRTRTTKGRCDGRLPHPLGANRRGCRRP
jgi:hypothetical protein